MGTCETLKISLFGTIKAGNTYSEKNAGWIQHTYNNNHQRHAHTYPIYLFLSAKNSRLTRVILRLACNRKSWCAPLTPSVLSSLNRAAAESMKHYFLRAENEPAPMWLDAQHVLGRDIGEERSK